MMICNFCSAGIWLNSPEPKSCEFCNVGMMVTQSEDDGPMLDRETRDRLTEADKTELALWWAGKECQHRAALPFKMRCDYEQCRRILYRETPESFRCSACGHKDMREAPPKATCCECGGPVYDNANADCEATCGRCVARKVQGVHRKEVEQETEFKGTGDMIAKTDAWADYLQTDGGKLKSARLNLGCGNSQLAEQLGVTCQVLTDMERNKTELTDAAREFVAARKET